MKTQKINGRTFEISKKAKNAYDGKIAAYDIFDAYGKPSILKHMIWEDWEEILNTSWIHGYNSCTFSICGKLIEKDTNKEYAIYITKEHRYAFEI